MLAEWVAMEMKTDYHRGPPQRAPWGREREGATAGPPRNLETGTILLQEDGEGTPLSR